ncbi:unnamed protein product [Calypogeia fissa]
MEGHLSFGCPIALAAKSILMSMEGAMANTVAATDSVVRMISIIEADDEASNQEDWEHASELSRELSVDEEKCYSVSTKTKKHKERLKGLKEKQKKPSKDEHNATAKVDNDYEIQVYLSKAQAIRGLGVL